MFKLSLIFYLRVLAIGTLVLFINKTYESYVTYYKFIELGIDWKITFSKLSLIITSICLELKVLTKIS